MEKIYPTKTKMRLIVSVLAMLTFFGLTTLSAAETTLKWTGCGITKKAFMKEAAAAYKKKTGVTIKLSGGGATKGIRFANSGMADIGGSCRPALKDKFPAEEGQVYMTVTAWDALVPVVHPDNPVGSISSDQLKKIMKGEITNWEALGGSDQKIQVMARIGKIGGVGYMARKVIFGNPDEDFAPDAKIHKSSGPLEKGILKDPAGFGITGISSAKRRELKGRKLKILKVDGNEASVENIASGAYPTFRPLYLATKGKPAGEVKKFLDWLLSAEGQDVVESSGTVSVRQGAGMKAKFKFWENTDRIVNFASLP